MSISAQNCAVADINVKIIHAAELNVKIRQNSAFAKNPILRPAPQRDRFPISSCSFGIAAITRCAEPRSDHHDLQDEFNGFSKLC